MSWPMSTTSVPGRARRSGRGRSASRWRGETWSCGPRAGCSARSGSTAARGAAVRVPAPPAAGAVLDLGCGWGPIAIAMKLRSPQADVWAVDVNERALALAADNARIAGISIKSASPQDIPEGLRFTTIWSNPPIRVGKNELHAMLEQWLPRLEPGASAWLVVAQARRRLAAGLDRRAVRRGRAHGAPRGDRPRLPRARGAERARATRRCRRARPGRRARRARRRRRAASARRARRRAPRRATRTARRPPPSAHGERRRSRTGAAGQRLAAAALVHAHPDAADAVPHERLGRNDELDVRACGGLRLERGGCVRSARVELVVVGEGDHHVRVRTVTARPGRATCTPGTCTRISGPPPSA